MHIVKWLDVNSQANLEIHHKWLLCPDAYWLVAVEEISDTRIDIDSEPVNDIEFDSESGTCRELQAFSFF